MTRSRSKKEERKYRKSEHLKACCILMSQTAKKLHLGLTIGELYEVFRLAYASCGGYTEEDAREDFSEWIEDPRGIELTEVVENFCLDILSNRIQVLPRHIKAKKKG